MASILKRTASLLALLATLELNVLAGGLESKIPETKIPEFKIPETKIEQLTYKTINHPVTLKIPKPNGTLYVVRGKDIIEHRNPKKENYGIILELIEYKDNGKKGYSFSDRITIVAELNYLQPAGRNGYENFPETKKVEIQIGVGYNNKSLIEVCIDEVITPFENLRADRRDQVETIIDHAIRELNPKLYKKH